MNKILVKQYFYWRFSRSYTKRDKFACQALYHNYSLDYRIYPKNLKRKRFVIYKVNYKVKGQKL